MRAVPPDAPSSATARPSHAVPGRELSDERLVSRSRMVALISTLPLALTGALSLYIATRGSGRGDALPWLFALGTALIIVGVRLQQRHQGRVFVTATGLVVRTMFGSSVPIAWAELEGARVGLSPWGLPSRYPGYMRVRLRSRHPVVGRWVTTIASSRDAALGATREMSAQVRLALAAPRA